MDLKGIQVFLKIVEYKKLTDAAESLHMTQPAVSNILRRMEEELGTPLFVRRGKTLVLNEQGEIFYEAAQNQVFAISRAVDSAARGLAGRRELIIATAVPSDWIIQTAGAFSEGHPDIRLVFQPERYIPHNHRLSTAELLLLPAWDIQEGEEFLTVDAYSSLCALLPLHHPLAGEKILTLRQLRGEDFVFIRREDGNYEWCYFDCLREGFRPRVSLTANTQATKLASIRCGCGIGVVYDNELALAQEIRDCVVVPIRSSIRGGSVCLAWYADYLSEDGKEFIEFVRGRLGSSSRFPHK